VSALLVLAQAEAAVPEDDGWLAPRERERARAFRFAARRRDFRLGRWTAKRALARFLGAGDAPAELAALEIRGAPRSPPVPWWRGAPAPCALSISHRAGAALAAVAPPGVRLGCDLERGEPRSEAFVAQFFAPAERARFAALSEPLRSRAAALAWSAKESAVKALGRGLDLDTRELEVELAPHDLAQPGRWRPLRVAGVDSEALPGFWCGRGAWLLTLVAEPALAAPRWIVP
jgi:4'-phosphopantetheinyl transferase